MQHHSDLTFCWLKSNRRYQLVRVFSMKCSISWERLLAFDQEATLYETPIEIKWQNFWFIYFRRMKSMTCSLFVLSIPNSLRTIDFWSMTSLKNCLPRETHHPRWRYICIWPEITFVYIFFIYGNDKYLIDSLFWLFDEL